MDFLAFDPNECSHDQGVLESASTQVLASLIKIDSNMVNKEKVEEYDQELYAFVLQQFFGK